MKLRAVIAVAGICSGQIPHYVEIALAPEINSESVFIRYSLSGEDFGGWVQPRSGVASYLISTTRNGRQASRIRALLYAPGCALQTLDLAISGSNNPQYFFICRPLSTISITGAVTRSDRLYGRQVNLQAKYVARWAQSFLGLGDGVVTDFRVGEAVSLSPDGHFRLSVPYFSQDPLADTPDHPGEFQIWARDKTSADLIAQLVPDALPAIRTRMGGLRIQSGYPSEIVFAPCTADRVQAHDAIGFALRPGAMDSCDR